MTDAVVLPASIAVPVPVAFHRGLSRRGRAALRPLARHLVALTALAAGVHFVLPQITTAQGAIGAAAPFRWAWLPAIALAGGVTYAMAALSLMAAAGTRLPVRRTVAAQLAAAFTNRLLPAGVGAMATNVRYLERAGVARLCAVAAVGLDSVAGFVVHASALLVVLAVFGASHQHVSIHGPDLPDDWALLVLVAAVLPAIGVATAMIRRRSGGRRWETARRMADQFVAVARDPRRTARLLGASAGVTLASAVALWASVQATGGGLSLIAVLAVYLGGSALAAAAPTPGGLGAVEAGLIAGLTAVGQPASAAVTSVLVFRLVTYWLPVLPGAVSFWRLRRAGTL
jgi:undecaprenyl-diphosphatase